MHASYIERLINAWTLPRNVRREIRKDRSGLPPFDPGPASVLAANIEWLKIAQDHASPVDGGVARDFSLIDGWSSSYPETTGYIVPTLIRYAKRFGHADLIPRAARMLDWLVAHQFPDGGIKGGKIDAQPSVPVTFNTGQVLIGLAAGVSEFGERYRDPMNRAASWLRDSLDDDGCWRRHPTPFAAPGEKTYETHVSWGLFEAARIEPEKGYGEAGLKQVSWALTKQHSNGWLADCCLSDPLRPLTHTLAYALRGILEAHRYRRSQNLLAAAQRTADGLGSVLEEDGRLPGCLDASWRPAADWVCLTGAVQTASCWFILFQETGEPRYRDWARRASQFVRRTVDVDGPPDIRGGVKGSFPVNGAYGRFQYLNWAAKFCADAQMDEIELLEIQSDAPSKGSN